MNGVLILDKPQNFTSFDAVAVMRKITGEKKIGHTGTLDPMATGVLPLLLGRAAKAADLLPDTDKAYRAAFRFGIKTDTGDSTGKITETEESPVTEAALQDILLLFRGEIEQIPPMYSAVSVNGQRLYKLARQGIEIERAPRKVRIAELSLVSYEESSRTGVLAVSCSKGTYIRTLIEDIAAKLGTVGTMTALRRTQACGFSAEEALTLEEIRMLATAKGLAAAKGLAGKIRPTDSLFAHLRGISVSAAQAARFQNGGALAIERLKIPGVGCREGESLRIYTPQGEFLGLGQAELAAGEIKIQKLFMVKGQKS